MIRSPLPPRGLFLGTRVLFTRDLSPHLKETLLQILALCASTGGHATPPVTIRGLAQLTAKPDRTLREHIALLQDQGLLQINPTGRPYQFTLHLADWLFDDRLTPGDAPLESAAECSAEAEYSAEAEDLDQAEAPTVPQPSKCPNPARSRAHLTPGLLKEEEYNLIFNSNMIPLPPNLNNPNGRQPKSYDTGSRAGSRAGTPSRGQKASRAHRPRRIDDFVPSGSFVPASADRRAADSLPADLRERLLAAGVFPALLREIAARAEQDAYAPEDLLALLDWCAADQPEGHAALFIGRLRAGARAPAAYTQPVCPRCGQRGGHAPDCPRRYLADSQ